MHLRVISAYRPVFNPEADSSVYAQQNSRCPRIAFIEDLAKDVTIWMAAGDQIILGIDANDDVRNCSLSTTLQELGLYEAITKKHGQDGPPTHDQGSTPIDGCYVSSGLLGL